MPAVQSLYSDVIDLTSDHARDLEAAYADRAVDADEHRRLSAQARKLAALACQLERQFIASIHVARVGRFPRDYSAH